MPTLSVYAVSVTVGGRGSAIIDWKQYIYASKCSTCICAWQSRVEIEHYSVMYFHRITVFEAL